MWLGFVGMGMAAGLALAQAPPPTDSPPLLPGEILFRTANDCFVIRDEVGIKAPSTPESVRADTAKMLWSGVCKDGLAEGKGVLGSAATIAALKGDTGNTWEEASHGRFTGRVSMSFTAMPTISYHLENAFASFPAHDTPYQPVWSGFPMSDARTTLFSPDGSVYTAETTLCVIDRARFKNCSGEGYVVFGVRVYRISHPDGHELTVPESVGQIFWCPDPKKTAGCEALWNEKTAEAVSQINAFLERFNSAALAKERRLTELNATWPAKYAALEERRRADAQREAARAQAQRDAEARRLAAERDLEAKTFQTKLSTSNAGQLFSLADELASKGEADKARQTLRALVSRFPDHPLAATAAQQMAGTTATGTGPPAAPQTAVQSAGNRSLSGGASSTNAGRCVPDSSLIPAYVQAQHEWVRYADNSILQPITTERAIAYFNEAFEYSKGLSTEQLRESLAESRRYYGRWDSSQLNPQQAYNLAGSRITNAMTECEIQRRGSAPSTVANPSSGATGCASTPQESFRRFSDELEQFSLSKPNAPPTSTSGSGARDQNQYALFYGTEGLTILEKYRVCLSPADYQANKTALEGMRDNGRAGCERLSTSPDSCTATYPAGWPAN
jgi:hypothetical protein